MAKVLLVFVAIQMLVLADASFSRALYRKYMKRSQGNSELEPLCGRNPLDILTISSYEGEKEIKCK